MIEFSRMKVRTRFAPSPTGMPHIGHLRTAAYAYALAKHNNGDFILRIEDTDQKRYVPEAIEVLKNTLKAFNLNWDEYFVQSERLAIYRKAAEKLVELGYAYNSDGAIKLKIPKDETISYRDFVFREEISWNTKDVYEPVLLKSDGFPTYHLAAAVDDHEMNITHVLRGYDWMSSTPIHLLVYRYLGYEIPEIGHLTDIQSPEGGKLSKRKGSTSIQNFLDNGYLPEALFNFVILMGWAPKDNQELFTLAEFVEKFNENGFQKSNPRYVPDKLNWFNQQYIKRLSNEELIQKLSKFSIHNQEEIKKIVHLVRDRLVTLKDFDSLVEYFFMRPQIVQDLDKEILDTARMTLEQNFDGKYLEEKARAFCAQKNIKVGEYFMTLRVAVTGKTATPPLWDIMQILGKNETLDRLKAAHAKTTT